MSCRAIRVRAGKGRRVPSNELKPEEIIGKLREVEIVLS
jgi:hypothetical protein